MANAFGIIAALFLAAAAYFGFQNKHALADQRALRDREQNDLDDNNEVFAQRVEEVNALVEATTVANNEQADFAEKLKAQLATNTGLQSDIDDKKSVVESKQQEVDAGNEELARIGNPEDLKRDLEQLRLDLATLEGELLLRDTEIKTRENLIRTLGVENSALEDVLKRYATQRSLANLNARVSKVVGELGFVILSGGDNAGIIRGSILEVQRGGETIGKLEVTATETTSAAASMIPDSFTDGSRVRVGDKVVASN